MKTELQDTVNAMCEDVSSIQKGLLTNEQKTNTLWNVMNAVIRVLDKKGLIDNESLAAAGKELWEEHKANMEAVKVAAKERRELKETDITKPPIDGLISAANKEVKRG